MCVKLDVKYPMRYDERKREGYFFYLVSVRSIGINRTKLDLWRLNKRIGTENLIIARSSFIITSCFSYSTNRLVALVCVIRLSLRNTSPSCSIS